MAIAIVVVLVVLTVVFAIRRLTSREDEQTRIVPVESPSLVQTAALTRGPKRCYRELLPKNFVVLDLETTGLRALTDEIIEIGAIRVDLDSTEQLAFQILVKPKHRLPEKITEKTGITKEMLEKDGVSIEDALPQFIEFIGELPLVTFNAEFDMAFLHSAAKGLGLSLENPYTCALKRARRAWPGLRSYRLSALAKIGNLSEANTHRAVPDCERALIVFTSATEVIGQKIRWTKPPGSKKGGQNAVVGERVSK